MPAAGSATSTSLWPADGYGGLDLLGRAFVASVAYVGPENFAGNIQGAARNGNPRLWVVRDTNLMMMVVQ
jgi:manganese transport protein